MSIPEPSAEALRARGFCLLHAEDARAWLERHGTLADWDSFAASWNGMAVDTYMADGGRYRRRRHAVFAAASDTPVIRRPAAPHYQTVLYNNLNGGVERWFEPTPPDISSGATFQTVLRSCRELFDDLAPGRSWHVETHQFRIEAGPDTPGQPTPEGMHRDGVDYVLVLLIGRVNIASGTTTIHALDHAELGSFTLATPLDAALVDDSRVFHGVTAVRPLDPAQPAHRDVLVVTFRAP